MTSSDGLYGRSEPFSLDRPHAGNSLGLMLFESLVHVLIEKGVLSKNDALSVVQTIAEIKSSERPEDGGASLVDAELTFLRRLYDSFEALRDRSGLSKLDLANVLPLRPPIHGDAPHFPEEDLGQ